MEGHVRVLHVDTSLDDRGGQRQLAYLLAGRPQDGWAGVPGSPMAALAGEPPVRLRRGNDPRNAWALRRALAGGGWDLVAAHTPHALVTALLAGAATVAHRRVDFPIAHPWPYRRARAVIAVSHAVAGVLARVGIESQVVHDGVVPPADAGPGLAELLGNAPPRPVYGAFGALVAHKGHALLLEAFARVPGTLVLAGDGPLRTALQQRAHQPDLAGRVHVLGHLPAPGRLMRDVDVVVHPSREEGFGQVVVEALALGCRVVACAAGGLPEAVGDAGWLVPSGDAGALAEALRQAVSATFAPDRARAHARRFDVAAMVAGTTAAYRRALTAG